MPTHVTLRLDEAEHAGLAVLADAAGTTLAGWLRAAVAAAEAHEPTARRIARAVEPDRRGGSRPGAGRPPRRSKTS